MCIMYIYICMYLWICLYECRCFQMPEEGARSQDLLCVAQHWCWELNMGPLKYQKAFLTTEPSL